MLFTFILTGYNNNTIAADLRNKKEHHWKLAMFSDI